MIAKLITHADSRAEAIRCLSDVVAETVVWPVKTNAAFLVKLLALPDFQSGAMTTGLIESHGDDLTVPASPSDNAVRVAAAALMERHRFGDWKGAAWGLDHAFSNRSQELVGFRLNAAARRDIAITDGINIYSTPFEKWPTISGIWCDGLEDGELVKDHRDGAIHYFTFPRWSGAGQGGGLADGAILAPMPGKVIAVDVAEGQAVDAGQRLMVLEAMKMEHALTAPFAGTVAELAAREGQQVQVEALLARVVKAEA
jgi:3-methylcrotonyl-CoA carboxylase alpha subunit